LTDSHHRSPEELALALTGPLGQWSTAVSAQRARLVNDGIDPDLRQADAPLFVVAVRNVVRIARAVAGLHKDPQLIAAISAVDDAVPGARNVRSALEHVDQYAVHRGVIRRHPRVSAGQRVVFERSGDRYVVSVGELAFDVDVVAVAAAALADATLNAVDRTVGSHTPT
jgi:hypothetical protein